MHDDVPGLSGVHEHETTDTGETTTDPNQVRLRVVNPMSSSFGTCYTCETFVCTGGACMSAPGIMSIQCG
jgi:hypothetical protein